MNEQIILGTPFLTQIYPLNFNKMCFEFSLSPIDKDVKVIQENEIFSINILRRKKIYLWSSKWSFLYENKTKIKNFTSLTKNLRIQKIIWKRSMCENFKCFLE